MQGDLFSQSAQAAEHPIPGEGGRSPAPPARGPIQHTPDTIRVLALEALAEARAAETMPWDARVLRARTAMFPYWSEWLKGGEGDRLLAEFKAEMDRLQAPLDEVAPNWRRIWRLG